MGIDTYSPHGDKLTFESDNLIFNLYINIILKQLRWRQLAHLPDTLAFFIRFSSKDEEKRMSM